MGIIGRPKWGKDLIGQIRHMHPGEKGYTYPLAISFDKDRNAYLYLGAMVLPSRILSKGYVIPITRTGEGDADFQLDLRQVLGIVRYWPITDEPFEDAGYRKRDIVQLSYEEFFEKEIIIKRKTNPLSMEQKIAGLEKKMQEFVNIEKFEEAAKVKIKINSLKNKRR